MLVVDCTKECGEGWIAKILLIIKARVRMLGESPE